MKTRISSSRASMLSRSARTRSTCSGMPSPTPAAAALNEASRSLKRSCSAVTLSFASCSRASSGPASTACHRCRRPRTSRRRARTAARASSSRSTLCASLDRCVASWPPLPPLSATASAARGWSRGTSIRRSLRRARSRNDRTADPTGQPHGPSRCMYSGTSSGRRRAPHELDRSAAAVDRERGQPQLRRALACQRFEKAGKAFGPPERRSRSTSMSRC